MRIAAELPRPDCKITIFSMNMRFLIKIEKGGFEQTYKISEMDVTDGVNGIFQILDEEFIASALKRFDEMQQDFGAAYQRAEY